MWLQKIVQLKPILDHINDRFKCVYTPDSGVLMHELLMIWKRQLSWKVYIPSKRGYILKKII